MKTCLYYWIVEPVQSQFRDTHERRPVWQVDIPHSQGVATFALFLDEIGFPSHARLAFPNLAHDEIPPQFLSLIQAVREHFLSVLRLTFRQDALLFPHPVWGFVEHMDSFSIALDIIPFHAVPGPFQAENARDVFTQTFTHREEVRLLLDSRNPHIPLQYRFLSLYRLVELVYRPRGRWRDTELTEALSPYASRFQKAGFTEKPLSVIHSLRDKCAHIRTPRGSFGVTHLNHREAAKVQACLPVLFDFCRALVNERSNGHFELRVR
jgi:hypothetical protein